MILAPSGRFRGAEVIDAGRAHLEPEELRALFVHLDALGVFWKAYFRLQFYYGLRVSEPAIAFREDVSIATSQVLLRRLKKPQFGTRVVEENGKKKRVRDETNKVGDGFSEYVYTLPPALAKLLDEHMRALDKSPKLKGSPWLFPSTKKPRRGGSELERMTVIRRTGAFAAVSRWATEKTFKAAAARAGLPDHLCHSHVLRHTRATLMLAEGASEQDVQQLLGHSSVSTTRQYLGVARALRLRLNTTARLGLGDGW